MYIHRFIEALPRMPPTCSFSLVHCHACCCGQLRCLFIRFFLLEQSIVYLHIQIVMPCVFQDWLKEWPMQLLCLKMIQENTYRLPNWLMLWLSKWPTLQIEWLIVLLIGRSIHGLIVAFWWLRDSLNHLVKKRANRWWWVLFNNLQLTQGTWRIVFCVIKTKGCGKTLMIIVLFQFQNTSTKLCVRMLSWNHRGISLKTTPYLSVHTMDAQSTQSQ